MLCKIESVKCGWQFRPVSERKAKAICRDVEANGGPSLRMAERDDFTAFFQDETAESLGDMFSLSPSQVRDLDNGWPIRFRCDDWLARQVYGYSSQESERMKF